MGTQVLSDIHNDLKLLITTITNFQEKNEEFKKCEKTVLSNIKHHRFLSVDKQATKNSIDELIKKFSIYGKYKVAKEFQDLVHSFVTSFDFEHHPQYDLQWSLLTLLLDLSSETNTSDLDCLKSVQTNDLNSSPLVENEEDGVTEEIDWARYLKEGQEEFFHNYESDTESIYSNEFEDEETCVDAPSAPVVTYPPHSTALLPIKDNQNLFDQLFTRGVSSQNWLLTNIQNTWWNHPEFHNYPIDSLFSSADFCRIWHTVTKSECKFSINTLSEYQACRELLWMLQVYEQMFIFNQDRLKFYVTPNTSIPSLTPIAFDSILQPFCKFFTMMYTMEQFDGKLKSKQPSFTYEAYNAMLKKYILRFKTQVVEIEKEFMKQDGCHSLLSLSSLLQKHVDNMKILYEIHIIVTSNWETLPNWNCALQLLSHLYFEIENSHTPEKANICTSLYLSSLSAYMNIIDTWLSEGRLEDWRDEFIITRVSENSLDEDNRSYERFEIRDFDHADNLFDPIFEYLIKKVQYVGHSIELLVSLNRMLDLWKMTDINNDRRISLNDEFHQELSNEISKYITENDIDRTDLCTISSNNQNHYDMEIEKNITCQLSCFDNPFLTKAFEDYMPETLFKKTDDVLDGNVNNQEDQIFQKIESVTQFILPIRRILEVSLSKILNRRYNGASKLVKNILKEEYKLEVHLKLMRSIYMMEAGHIMNKFYQILFNEIESNQTWNNSYFLSCILEEILSEQWPDSDSRWSISVNDIRTNSVIKAIDNISLHYSIEWPMSIVLNAKILDKYNMIFRFQLKLKWALWSLNNLRFNELEFKSSHSLDDSQNSLVKRLECLRFWLLHAITSIHAYLSGQVLQSLSYQLEQALSQTDSLDAIISVHNEYLDKVHEHCLLTSNFEDITMTINNLITMCSLIRDRWNRDKVFSAPKELEQMEHSYIKYHTYLALALHNSVQNKDADYYELTPRSRVITEKIDPIGTLTDLSRSLITEIAYQTFPPSGIYIPIPVMIQNQEWETKNLDLSISEYDQTFSYIRWYLYEQQYAPPISTCSHFKSEIQDIFQDV